MTRFLAITLAVIVTFGAGRHALGQAPACQKRPAVVDHLHQKYSEAPVAIGLARNGGVIEVLTSADGSSWTIIITMPNGSSCMIAAGTDWEAVPQKAKGNGT